MDRDRPEITGEAQRELTALAFQERGSGLLGPCVFSSTQGIEDAQEGAILTRWLIRAPGPHHLEDPERVAVEKRRARGAPIGVFSLLPGVFIAAQGLIEGGGSIRQGLSLPILAQDASAPYETCSKEEEDGHPKEAKKRAAPPGLLSREAPA